MWMKARIKQSMKMKLKVNLRPSNKKGKWSKKNTSDLLSCFESGKTLDKLTDADIRIIVRYMKRTKLDNNIKESATKQQKLAKICDYIGVEQIVKPKKESKKTYTVKSLHEIAFSQVSKMKKSELNIVYAEYLWPEQLRQWTEEYPPIQLLNELCPATWFYKPNKTSSRDQLEVSCVDSTHLLTRTRRKCCKGGIEGISNEPWRKVAKQGNTSLALGMIDGVLEPMSVSVACCHFTIEVEEEMRRNEDTKAADLCRDIRHWWEAEDDLGIPAKSRITKRMSLRNRLLGYVDLSHFPPKGMYINGWPCQLWEALVANIDAKILLYELATRRTYNVRAFSSMMGETFFAELIMFDRRGHGTVTAHEFSRFIHSTIEAMNIPIDPDRTFCYRTSGKTAYKLVEKFQAPDFADPEEELSSIDDKNDHDFDLPIRKKTKGKEKIATINRDRNAVKKGALGVRWNGGARRNESKMLPTLKMGLDI